MRPPLVRPRGGLALAPAPGAHLVALGGRRTNGEKMDAVERGMAVGEVFGELEIFSKESLFGLLKCFFCFRFYFFWLLVVFVCVFVFCFCFFVFVSFFVGLLFCFRFVFCWFVIIFVKIFVGLLVVCVSFLFSTLLVCWFCFVTVSYFVLSRFIFVFGLFFVCFTVIVVFF